jgi:hypothetical protein
LHRLGGLTRKAGIGIRKDGWARGTGKKDARYDGGVALAEALGEVVALEPALDQGPVDAAGAHVEDGLGAGVAEAAVVDAFVEVAVQRAHGLSVFAAAGGIWGGIEEGNFVASAAPALLPSAEWKRLRRGCCWLN